MLLELIVIASAGVNISVGCLLFYIYFKLKNVLTKIKMNTEELLQDLLEDTTPAVQQDYAKRETLSAIVARGRGGGGVAGREVKFGNT